MTKPVGATVARLPHRGEDATIVANDCAASRFRRHDRAERPSSRIGWSAAIDDLRQQAHVDGLVGDLLLDD
jgi:hypothetical protein